MEMMIISLRDGMTAERVAISKGDCRGLIPESISDPDRRTYRFNQSKKVVVFTSKVHPGATPSSHVLNGSLTILVDLKSE